MPPASRRIALALAVVAALTTTVAAAPLDPSWVATWRSDLAFAADSLPRAHPNFFHATTPAAYRAALDSLSRRLPHLEQHEAVVALACIIATVGEGHTRATFPFDSGAGYFTGHAATAPVKIPGLVFRHYPVRFGLFGDSLWVIAADSAHRELLGGRVLTIGGRPASDAMRAVRPAVYGDNDQQVRALLPNWMVCPEILHARGVIADRARAEIVVANEAARVTATLAPVPIGTAVRWISARRGPARLVDHVPERSHWFTPIAGTHTVYARYREVKDDRDESVAAFSDSLFAHIASSGADRLVLDLRGNVGGNGDLNRTLLQHAIRAEQLWRPGALWALIDRGTFSAAVMLAADLEMRTPAVLVGEKTAGNPNSYGDSRRVVLPGSGVTVRVSSLYWQSTSPQDRRDGITPHVGATPSFDDWRAGRDPALDAALAPVEPVDRLAGEWSGAIGWQFARPPIRLTLERDSTEWNGRVTLRAAGLDDAPLAAVRTSADGISARWGDGAWSLQAQRIGGRLIGLVRYKGLDYSLVMEPAGAPAR